MIQAHALTSAFGIELHLTDDHFRSPAAAFAELVPILRTAFVASHGLLLIRSLNRLEGWSKENMITISSAFGKLEESPADGAHESLLQGDERIHVFSKVPSARVFDRADADSSGEATLNVTTRADPDRFDPQSGCPAWHTDNSFRRPSPRTSVLYCRSAPSAGGDTLFASTIAAWEALPTEVQLPLLSATATHSLEQLHSAFRRFSRKVSAPPSAPGPSFPPLPTSESESHTSSSAEGVGALTETEGEAACEAGGPSADSANRVDHPIAPVHRTTGRRALYLAPAAMSKITFADEEARQRAALSTETVVDWLMVQATAPSFRYRHKWRTGDLLIWDNTCTLHAPTKLAAEHVHEREMWRSTVLDDDKAEDVSAASTMRETSLKAASWLRNDAPVEQAG